MAITDFLNQESMSQVGQQASNIAVIFISVIVFVGIIGVILFLWTKNRKYEQFKCIIWEKDGFGNMTQTFDDAGIFVDGQTKNKRLFLKRNNVGLSPDNIPFILSNKKKYIFLLKTGLKNFAFVKPNFDDIYKELKLNVSEEDVNWAINAYERQKKLFTNSLLMQLLPFILMAFVCVCILIIFVYFFRNFGVLKEVALAFKDAARYLAQGNAGTIIVE